MIQSIVHIALVVKDYDEAIEFHTKKLCFELVEDTYQLDQEMGSSISPRFKWNINFTCKSI